MLGVDDPCLRYSLEISVLIKGGPGAYLVPWKRHGRCPCASLVMYSSGTKFEERCSNISEDILDWCSTVLVEPSVKSSVSSLA